MACMVILFSEWMKVARTSKEAKTQENREHKIAELEKKIRDMVRIHFDIS